MKENKICFSDVVGLTEKEFNTITVNIIKEIVFSETMTEVIQHLTKTYTKSEKESFVSGYIMGRKIAENENAKIQ